jgi:hypothetical protein
MHCEHMRRRAHQADRREVLHGVVGDFRIEARIDDEIAAAGKQRIAVRGRARGRGDAEIAAGAGEILHIELLPQALREFLRKQPRGGVIGATGGDRHDHADRTRRVGLCAGGARQRRSSDPGHSEELAANKCHGHRGKLHRVRNDDEMRVSLAPTILRPAMARRNLIRSLKFDRRQGDDRRREEISCRIWSRHC